MKTKFADASHIGIKSFRRVFTLGELVLTLDKPLWDEDELVGCIYRDQTGQVWHISNDTTRLVLQIC